MCQSSGLMVSSMNNVTALGCPAAHVSQAVLCLFADNKMKLLKEAVALESISGKEYDVRVLIELILLLYTRWHIHTR